MYSNYKLNTDAVVCNSYGSHNTIVHTVATKQCGFIIVKDSWKKRGFSKTVRSRPWCKKSHYKMEVLVFHHLQCSLYSHTNNHSLIGENSFIGVTWAQVCNFIQTPQYLNEKVFMLCVFILFFLY